MSTAPAWAAGGLLVVALVLASGRIGGAPEPAREATWAPAPAPAAAESLHESVACPEAARQRPPGNGA